MSGSSIKADHSTPSVRVVLPPSLESLLFSNHLHALGICGRDATMNRATTRDRSTNSPHGKSTVTGLYKAK